MKKEKNDKINARHLDALSQTLTDGYETMVNVVEALDRDDFPEIAEMFRKNFLPPFANGPKLLADAAGHPNLNIHHIVARPVMSDEDIPLADGPHRKLPCYYTDEEVWVSEESYYHWVGDEEHIKEAIIPPCMDVRFISMFAAVDPDGPMKAEELTLDDAGFSDILQVYANHKHDRVFSAAFDSESNPTLAERNRIVLKVSEYVVERLKSMGIFEEDADLSEWTTVNRGKATAARIKNMLDNENPDSEDIARACKAAIKATMQHMPEASVATIKEKLRSEGLGILADHLPDDSTETLPEDWLQNATKELETGAKPNLPPLTKTPAQ